MYDQPKIKPFNESDFFADGRGMRTPVAGTVARGHLHEDELMHAGTVNGTVANVFPMPVTKAMIERGAGRYQIHCAPCHAPTGNGLGMVVQRGMYRPPSLHDARLVQAPAGHFFNVITNGIGNMNGYGSYISTEDRWAIVSYVRALQYSQSATLADVPNEHRAELEEAK